MNHPQSYYHGRQVKTSVGLVEFKLLTKANNMYYDALYANVIDPASGKPTHLGYIDHSGQTHGNHGMVNRAIDYIDTGTEYTPPMPPKAPKKGTTVNALHKGQLTRLTVTAVYKTTFNAHREHKGDGYDHLRTIIKGISLLAISKRDP